MLLSNLSIKYITTKSHEVKMRQPLPPCYFGKAQERNMQPATICRERSGFRVGLAGSEFPPSLLFALPS